MSLIPIARVLRAAPHIGILSLLSLFLALPVYGQVQQPRIALVIGNADYKGGTWGALHSPRNDADKVERTLSRMGFSVQKVVDADLSVMDRALTRFGEELRASPGALAFFYFSGHGVQAPDRSGADVDNFLIPVEAGLEAEVDAPYKALSLRRILDTLSSSRVGGAVVVLDACRTNGFRRSSKGTVLGLASIEGARGFLVAYAAQPNRTAADGTASLSPYTQRLVELLPSPNRSVVDVFIDVTQAVEFDTHGDQQPDVLVRLRRNIFLSGPAGGVASPVGQARQVNDTNEYFDSLKKRAQGGDVVAQCELGVSYLKGTDLSRDYSQAVFWFRLAANAGYACAQHNLGVMHANGWGVKTNLPEATSWFRKAADQGYPGAQDALARMYLVGDGTGRGADYVQAAKWFRRAAENGVAQSALWLGKLYDDGSGVTRDRAQAASWFRKAIELGAEEAQGELVRRGLD